jgi:alpha-tubulin suppressor-like RCC1 family protein
VANENSNIVEMCGGQYHSMFLKSNGKVYTFGRNNVNILINEIRMDNLGMVP